MSDEKSHIRFVLDKEFYFENEGECKTENGVITIKSNAKTDFFSYFDDEQNKLIKKHNAPFLYTEVSGDFVCSVRMKQSFDKTYDSAVLMIMDNEDCWAKACFELTDFNTTAVVSVVNNTLSDDANGNNISTKEVYLKVVRVSSYFSFHYSIDGKEYNMMRYFTLPTQEKIKVGLVSQSPLGEGSTSKFDNFRLENMTVKNIRKGV